MRQLVRSLVVLAMVLAAASTACASPRKALLRPAAHLAESRAGHSTTALPDGRLLVIGGFRKGADGHRQLHSATTEIIDVARQTVTAGPALHRARAGHAAITVGDGRILVAGGWDDAIADLGRASYLGTATAVGPDLVVIGGYDDHVRASNAIWIIHP